MTRRTIEDVLGKIKVPVRSVAICLDADLQAEHDDLTAQLERLRREANGKMSDGGEIREVADRIKAIEQQMRDSEQTFKFRGLSKNALNKLYERFPAPEDKGLLWDVEAGAHALLAESAVEPTMTDSQAQQLLNTLSQGQSDRLVGCAWLASTGSTQVPFSVRASELTSGTDSN